MFKWLKKRECSNCGEKTRRGINYAGYEICSEKCMIEFFKNITTEELLELEAKDRLINQDYYRWLGRG